MILYISACVYVYMYMCVYVCACVCVSETLRRLTNLHVIFGGTKHEKN